MKLNLIEKTFEKLSSSIEEFNTRITGLNEHLNSTKTTIVNIKHKFDNSQSEANDLLTLKNKLIFITIKSIFLFKIMSNFEKKLIYYSKL